MPSMPRRSPPKGVTGLQIAVGTMFFDEPVSEGFAVAGDAAFAAYRFSTRLTRDLLLVGVPDQAQVSEAAARLHDEALGREWVVQELPSELGTSALLVEGMTERLVVTLREQARVQDVGLTLLGPTLHPDDLAMDALIRLESGLDPLILVDLQGWSRRFSLDRLCEIAAKVPGVSEAQIASAVTASLDTQNEEVSVSVRRFAHRWAERLDSAS